MFDGMINIYKEKSFTSHDVVAKMRGILKQKKIGHTGTLDPEAVGVLPICLGKGTKLCDMLTDKDKIYEATLLLGVSTDTEDTSGKILKECEVNVSELEIRQVINSFIGKYKQIPPMYSAIKVNGKKLYELAREGKVIQREPRLVEIYKIDILKIDIPRVIFTVECSKGTYIRSLCRDIGEKLGCLGCMESLKRTKVGDFHIEDALKLDEVQKLVDNGTLKEYIKPVDFAFLEYKKVNVSKNFNKLIYNGNIFGRNNLVNDQKNIEFLMGEIIRVYDEDNNFVGVYQYKYDVLFKPVKMFL